MDDKYDDLDTEDRPDLNIVDVLDPVQRLTRDLRLAARTLSDAEARFLVDAYYAMQDDRIRARNQVRALSESAEPNTIMQWLSDQRYDLEKQVARALDYYSGAQAAGEWARSITGIGPIFAAGLLAHVDVKNSPTVGHIWRYAGLDPTSHWIGTVKATELVTTILAKHKDKPLTTPTEVPEIIVWAHFIAMLTDTATGVVDATRANLIATVAETINRKAAAATIVNTAMAEGTKRKRRKPDDVATDEQLVAIVREINIALAEKQTAKRNRVVEIPQEALVEVAESLNIRTERLVHRLTDRDTGEVVLTRDALIRAAAKRPWNASLKRLCFLIGESFVKVHNLKTDYYGKVYVERKEYELTKNEAGHYANQCEESLATKNFGRDTDARAWYTGCYPAGTMRELLTLDTVKRTPFLNSRRVAPGAGVPMLPPARIHRRSCRYAVKLFISHYHHVAYELEFGEAPPKPYIIEHGGHTHFLYPPNWTPPKRRG